MDRKIVFLDRDGVINIERGEYTYNLNDTQLVPGIMESALLLADDGYEFIIISNQGGISKDIYSKIDVLNIDKFIRSEFQNKGLEILDSFYCPHHNEVENCLCRKPKSIMLEKALAKYNIFTKNTLFIGDSERDKIAGENLGIRSIQVKANSSILDLSKTLINE